MKPGEWGTRGGASRLHLIESDGLSVCGRRGPFEPIGEHALFPPWSCGECVEILRARLVPAPAPLDPIDARRARAAASI